jgi:hypothetical protein
MLIGANRNNLGIVAENSIIPSMKEMFQILTTFSLTVLAWVFFRSETVSDALSYLSIIFSKSLLSMPNLVDLRFFPFILILIIWEWVSRRKEHGLMFESKRPVWIRWGAYIFLISLIIQYMGRETPFIYFQF